MNIVSDNEFYKLDLAFYFGWKISLASNQHLLGWLILFPPTEMENSIVNLSESEIINFKKVGLLCEELLKNSFNAEWFNYLQEGNGVKRIHIHLHPRYSTEREFAEYKFVDSGWGRKVKFLNNDELPNKEIVFKIADFLRDNLKQKQSTNSSIKIIELDKLQNQTITH